MKKKQLKQNNLLGQKSGFLSVFLNGLLFIVKYWVGVTTGSVALIADAWHTLSDSITSIIVIIGLKVSAKPADSKHPYGHGRTELIASVIVGVLLGLVGFHFVKESIFRLKYQDAPIFGKSAIIVVIISIVVKELLAQISGFIGRKIDSNLVVADAWHHRSDAISSAVILIGILFSKKFWWIDGVLGIMVSFFIFQIAFDILKKACSSLIGEKPSDELIKSINDIVKRIYDQDMQLHHFHCHCYGNHQEITFHIQLPGNIDLKEAHRIATEMENAVRDELGVYSTIHMEPRREQERE